jgi:hypothetical protein
MALLNELDCSLYVIRHAQASHYNRQSPPRESGNCDFVLDVAQLAAAPSTGAQYTHIEEFLQHQVLVLPSKGIRGVEICEAVGELAHGAAQLVVLAVVVAALDSVTAHDGCFPVVIIGLISVEVDLVRGEQHAAAGAMERVFTFLRSFCS